VAWAFSIFFDPAELKSIAEALWNGRFSAVGIFGSLPRTTTKWPRI
jgi:hypothetical protein